jgi:hypothetical protein
MGIRCCDIIKGAAVTRIPTGGNSDVSPGVLSPLLQHLEDYRVTKAYQSAPIYYPSEMQWTPGLVTHLCRLRLDLSA